MKKFLFIASALAIVAGCAKVTTVSTEEPQEIAFEAYTYGATKAPIADNSFPTDWSMQVHAIYDGGVNEQYFGDKGTIFTIDDAQVGGKNVWHDATTTRYWPLTGTLTFNAIAPVGETSAPEPDIVSLTPTSNSNFFTFSGGSVTAINATMADNSTTQTDVLVAKTANSPKVKSVSMTFKHALAQVVVSARLAADAASGSNSDFTINVKQINLKNTYQEGNLTATPDQDNVEFVWDTSGKTPEDKIEIYNGELNLSTNAVVFDGVDPNYGKAILVVPKLGDDVVLELVYDVTYPDNTTMKGVTGTIKLNTGTTAPETTLTTWEAGKKYIYNLTFKGPQEILIAPEVKPWVDEEVTVPGL